MKSGEVPFKLGDPFSQPPFKFVIRGEDDSARSRLFRFFLFPGIVHEIGMRFRFFFVSSLFHYLAGVPPTPSPALSLGTHASAGSHPRNRHEWPFYSSKGMRSSHIIQGGHCNDRSLGCRRDCGPLLAVGREGESREARRGDRRHEGAILSFRVH